MKRNILLTTLCLSLATGTAFAQYYGGGKGTESDPLLISSRAHIEELARMVNGGTNYEGYHFKLTTNLAGITTIIGNTENSFFSGNFDGDGHTIELNINSTRAYASVFARLSGATVKNTRVSGKVVSKSSAADLFAGGICGYADYSIISNCYNLGSISSSSSSSDSYEYPFAGGICGYAKYSTISNCYNTGNISTSAASSAYEHPSVGGICGEGGTISNSYNTGDISATSSKYSYAGGICGNSGTISNSYNMGNISTSGSSSYAGGICGKGDTISNCYNTGNISASSYAGGICGYSGNISNCFAANATITTTESSEAGRIVGYSGRISNCHALISMKISGLERRSMKADSKDGADREGADFKNESWLTSVLKWNFGTVWTISGSSGFPVLKGVNEASQSRINENGKTESDTRTKTNTESELEAADKSASTKANAFSDFNAYFETLAGRNLSPESKALRAKFETGYITAAIPKTEFAAFEFLYSALFIKADNIFRKPHYMASATILQKEMFRLNAKYMSKEVYDHYNTEAYILDKRLIIASMPAIVKDLADHKDEIPDFYKEAAVRYFFAYTELYDSFDHDDTVKYEKYSAFDEALSIFLHIVEKEYLNKETRLPFMKGEPYTSLFE